MISVTKPPFTPEEVGYEASRIQLLDEFFMEQMNKGVIRAASYCMAKDGKIFVNKAIGMLSRKAVEKMTRTYTKENVKDYCWCQPGEYRPYGLGPDKRCGDDFIYSPGTYGHEGAGRCNLVIDPVERLVISYFTPYVREEVWDAVPVWNSLAIMWSGLK